jgi:GNAT superfamily N-acetyltransferase
VTCFFIRSAWRRKGVATKLLAEAVRVAKANGATALEAYPVKPYTENIPAAFAWTGIPVLFENAKFTEITPPGNSRPVYRKAFRVTRSAK